MDTFLFVPGRFEEGMEQLLDSLNLGSTIGTIKKNQALRANSHI
jgi:hypothetical protein